MYSDRRPGSGHSGHHASRHKRFHLMPADPGETPVSDYYAHGKGGGHGQDHRSLPGRGRLHDKAF